MDHNSHTVPSENECRFKEDDVVELGMNWNDIAGAGTSQNTSLPKAATPIKQDPEINQLLPYQKPRHLIKIKI